MSIYRITSADVDSFTVVTNPLRHYVSSSTCGTTGSVNVFARRSSIEKEPSPLAAFADSSRDDADLNAALRAVQQSGRMARLVDSSPLTTGSFPWMMSDYMTQVNAQASSVRKQKVLEIIRFTPSVSLTSNTFRKLVVKDQLSTYYRTSYPSAHWAYTNYNSLNFFTSSTVPTSSVLLYPNIDGGNLNFHEGYVSGTYTPSGSITFDFYINPRYRPDGPDGKFKAGTIFHLTSCYALSLVTGSAKDHNGLPLGYRLLLQMSHSADVAPSTAVHGSYPNDLIFLSDDNSLKWNNWHHCVVRWGTNQINQGSGSFNIDQIDRGTFVIPSSTVAPRLFTAATRANPDVLCIGNYYEGKNDGTTAQAYFFADDPALRDGLHQLITDTSGIDEPLHYAFNHPLNAEVHDLAIKRYYMSDDDIAFSSSVGPKSIDESEIAFYLPPFFVESSSFRRFVGNHGGILQTPFFEIDGTTNDPFNVAMSFGVNGHYINVENFTRDFASNVFPRLHDLTASAITNSTEALEANAFLYNQPRVRKRNLLIMPCDDGLFVPSYELLASESLQSSAVDDLGLTETSFIHLDNMVMSSSLLFAHDPGDGLTYVNELIGYTPEQPGLAPGAAINNYVDVVAKAVSSGTFDPGVQEGVPLTIYQRTRDPSSNQVTFFDISNLYYGKRILPGSFEMTDVSFSGSSGAMNITLKDDGQGTVYRANCFTSASKWNAVGTIFYNEGIVAIKSPHLYFFGKEGYEISFRGEQNIHVLKFDVLAPANQMNSSSNPNFMVVPPSPFPNDPEKEFVYITGMNFHDDNFNVIAKTQLAQPIMKRSGDKLIFRCKIDF